MTKIRLRKKFSKQRSRKKKETFCGNKYTMLIEKRGKYTYSRNVNKEESSNNVGKQEPN